MTYRKITHSRYPRSISLNISHKPKRKIMSKRPYVSDDDIMHVCTAIYNQPNLVSSLHKSLSMTCTRPWNMHVIDNGSGKYNLEITRSICSSLNIKLLERKCEFPISRASQAHGDALDYAVANAVEDPNAIMCLVDSDVFFVHHGWDELIRKSLVAGGHVTTTKNQALMVPGAFLSILKKNTIIKNGISFMPKVSITGKALKAAAYKNNDVGHELIKISSSKWTKIENFKSNCPRCITDIEGSLDFYFKKIPIASHLSKGRLRRKDIVDLWISQCEKFFENSRT
jgi:hypothetical protein